MSAITLSAQASTVDITDTQERVLWAIRETGVRVLRVGQNEGDVKVISNWLATCPGQEAIDYSITQGWAYLDDSRSQEVFGWKVRLTEVGNAILDN